MKQFIEQLHKSLQKRSLTVSEKADLKARVVAFMEYHPRPAEAPVVSTRRRMRAVITEPFVSFAIPFKYLKIGASAFALFLVVGMPALAEYSVPGDVLYPMKVRVNEEVRASFTADGYDKVVWETRRLERRIAEARYLAKEGRLTPEIETAVIAAVTEHQLATVEELALLRTTDAEAAALAEMTLVSVLDVQSASLQATDDATPDVVTTAALAEALTLVQAQVAQGGEQPVSYDRLRAQLEIETTRARELLASINGDVSTAEVTDIKRRVQDLETKVGQAFALAETDQAAAIDQLKSAWRDTQVLITFMSDIDVRTSLALETFVPATLTPEEAQVLAIRAHDEAQLQLEQITERMTAVAEVSVTEKIAVTIPTIESLLTTASSSVATNSLAAKKDAEAALEYTRSLLALMDSENTDGVMMMTTLATNESTTTSTSTATTTSDTGEDDEVTDAE